MSKVQKISVALTPELNAMVQEAVASGQYATSSEVVREALRGWSQLEKAKALSLNHMRGLIQEGIDSGPGRFGSMEEIIAEARLRHKDLLKNLPDGFSCSG
jgi:antitoxin ParD1/3/4